jgi:uncharacterized protein involved in response to NO
MDILFLVFLAYLSYRNSVRAKLKKKNPLLWGLITAAAFVAALTIGLMVVVVFFCPNVIDFNRAATDPKYKEIAAQDLMNAFAQNPLHLLTVYVIGCGGYLLIRYILEKKPGEKEPEVHWMDKMGEK